MSVAIGSPDCDVGEVAWSGDTWTHSFALSCDEPTSVGPDQVLDEPERSLLWSGVTMTAPAGWFAFDLKASGPAWITIVRCDRPELLYLWADEPQINAYLDVGRYLVSADAYADVDTSATVTARRLAEAPDFATVYDAAPRGFVSHRAGDRTPGEMSKMNDLFDRFPYHHYGDICAPSYAPFFDEAAGMIGEACGSFIPQ